MTGHLQIGIDVGDAIKRVQAWGSITLPRRHRRVLLRGWFQRRADAVVDLRAAAGVYRVVVRSHA